MKIDDPLAESFQSTEFPSQCLPFRAGDCLPAALGVRPYPQRRPGPQLHFAEVEPGFRCRPQPQLHVSRESSQTTAVRTDPDLQGNIRLELLGFSSAGTVPRRTQLLAGSDIPQSQ